MIYIIQNAESESSGAILDWIKLRQIDHRVIRPYEGEVFPSLENQAGIILLGAPVSPHDVHIDWIKAESLWLLEALKNENQIFAVCFGSQLIAQLLGAEVTKSAQREVGWHRCEFDFTDVSRLQELGRVSIELFQLHGEEIIPQPHLSPFGSSKACLVQGFSNKKNVLGFTGHVEITGELFNSFHEHFHAWMKPHTGENFVQSESEMRAHLVGRLGKSKEFLLKLLDAWFCLDNWPI